MENSAQNSVVRRPKSFADPSYFFDPDYYPEDAQYLSEHDIVIVTDTDVAPTLADIAPSSDSPIVYNLSSGITIESEEPDCIIIDYIVIDDDDTVVDTEHLPTGEPLDIVDAPYLEGEESEQEDDDMVWGGNSGF